MLYRYYCIPTPVHVQNGNPNIHTYTTKDDYRCTVRVTVGTVYCTQIVEQIYKAHRWSVQYVVGGGERGRAIRRVGDCFVEVEASTF